MSLFPNYQRYEQAFHMGRGVELTDTDGKTYIDFGSGIGVLNLGHCHPKVTEALINQAQKLWHTSNLFTIPVQNEVAAKLCEYSQMGAVFFCNSGAEANEAALKLARKWAHEQKGIQHPEVITFSQSFHGRTLATLTATGQAKVKNGFAPLMPGFVEVPYGDIEEVKRVTHEQTAAICLELIQGEGGVNPADPQFIAELVKWCSEREILLIIDEVQTGMGRTGELFAFQTYGIKPDIVTLAKGLGNGFPVGAMLATESLKPILGPGSHGTTFGGNPLAMEVVKVVIDELTKPHFLAEVKEKADLFIQRLHTELQPLSIVKEIRSKGLMIGIELAVPVQPLIKQALDHGLILLAAGENVIRLLPPLTITIEQLMQGLSILKERILSLSKEGVRSK